MDGYSWKGTPAPPRSTGASRRGTYGYSALFRRLAIVALVAMLAISVYGLATPAHYRCRLPGSVGCAGGWLGPALAPAGGGDQWFDVTMYDWGFWIVDSTTGANESNAWTVFEGWTVHVNATSLPPDTAAGGTAYHGLGVEVNATGQQLLSLAAPVGQWVSATFVAPTSAYYHQHIWCTIYCGPGHGSQQAYVLDIVPAVNYPSAQAAANVTSGSAPLAVSFSGNGSGGAPPYSYSWNFGDGSPSVAGRTAAHNYSQGGIYYATLTVTDSKGNPGRATVTITVLSSAPLTAQLSASPREGDSPLGSNFSTTTHGGTPPYRYFWSWGDGANSSGPNRTSHVFTEAGIFAVAVAVTDSVGATVRALTIVTVHPANGTFALQATASPANGTAPLQTMLNATATGGTAPYAFFWEFGDGLNGTGAGVAHLYNGTGQYVATVFASDAFGRTASADVILPVTAANTSGGGGDDGGGNLPAGPSPSASGLTLHVVATPSGGGAPLNVTARASIVGGTGLSETVNWSFGDGASGTGPVVAHLFSGTGNFTVSVSARDSGGNTGAALFTVRVGPPIVSIVANATVGDSPFSVMVGTTVVGGRGTYGNATWDWGDHTSGSGYLATHDYGPGVTGSFPIVVTISDPSGTTLQASLPVTIDPDPVATISVSIPRGSSPPVPVTLTATVTGGSGGYATTLLWSFGDLSGTRGPPSLTHTYNRTGPYYVTVETNDSAGVRAVGHAWVNITPTLALPRGTSNIWFFTGVPDPQAAALVMLGLVGATGLLFLRRRRAKSRGPTLSRPPTTTAALETARTQDRPGGVP